MADPDFLFPPTALPPNDGHRGLAPWEWSQTQGMPGTPVNAPFPGDPLPPPPGQRTWDPNQAAPDVAPPTVEDPYAAMLRAAMSGGPKTSQTQSTTTSSQSGGLQDTPEARAAREAAAAAGHQQGTSARAAGDLAATQGLERSAQADQAAQALEGEAVKRQAVVDANAQDVAKLTSDLQTSRTQYQKQASELDPNRAVKGWRGIAAAIGSAMGAYGATLGRTQNFAQHIIDQAIEHDFDAQKTQLAAKRDDLTFAQQALTNRRLQFSDDLAARSAAKADTLDVLSAKVRSIGERHAGESAKANAATLADGLDAQAEQHRSDAIARYAQTKSTNSSATTQSSETSGLAGLTQALQLKKLAKESDGTTSQDETYANKVKAQIAGLGSGLKQAEALDQKLKDRPWYAHGPLSSTAQAINTDTNMLAVDNNRAATGASGRPEELAGQKDAIEGNWATLSDSAKRKQLGERMAIAARDAYGDFATLPPVIQTRQIEDLKKTKGQERLVYVLTHGGELPPAGADQVKELGGTTR